MAFPVTIPNTFSNATSSIPLSQLDNNFTTLVTALNGVANGAETLANVSITGGNISNVTLDNVTVDVETLSNVTITNLTVNGTANLTNSTVTANLATITTANVTTLNVSGNATLGDASGDSVTINAATVSTPNGLNFDSNTFVIDAANNYVGIGTSAPLVALNVNGSDGELIRISTPTDSGVQQEPALGFCTNVILTHPATKISSLEFDASDNRASLLFYTRGVNTDTAPTERMRITSAGEVLVGGTTEIAAGIGVTIQNGAVATNAPASLNLFRNDTSILSGNELGKISFYGNDTTSNTPTAHATIAAVASGEHAAGDNPTDITFGTTPDGSATVAEVARFTQDKYLRMASGTGGIQFGGDTAAANALDDYEEGTWTPSYGATTTDPTFGAYPFQEGYYTKIGNLVFVTGRLRTTTYNSDGAGNLQIEGLPFTPKNTSTVGGAGSGSLSISNNFATQVVAINIQDNSPVIMLRTDLLGNSATVASLNTGSNQNDLCFSLVYVV